MSLSEQEIQMIIKCVDLTLLRITQVIRDRNVQINSNDIDTEYQQYLIAENKADMKYYNELESLNGKLKGEM